MSMETLTWIGIALLVLQSGTFSGLNLAMFGVPALRLHTMSELGDEQATSLLRLREDSNFLLTTILWGNVGTNVLLTMASDSVMAGVSAFVFSTFVITFGGEIIPQAYFSRNALKMASLLSPLLRFYQFLLYPLAKPSSLILDAWLGKESIDYIGEDELRIGLKSHAVATESEISRVEGIGAVNFLELDDLLLTQEGNPLNPDSLVYLPFDGETPLFPEFTNDRHDPFIENIRASGERWVLLTPEGEMPRLALDTSAFLRSSIIRDELVDPMDFCHRPILVTDGSTRLAQVLQQLETEPGDNLIKRDLILLWASEKRIISGTDILGFLLRGIARPGAATR